MEPLSTWACDGCGEKRPDVFADVWKLLRVSIARHNGKCLFDGTVNLCPMCQRQLLHQIKSHKVFSR